MAGILSATMMLGLVGCTTGTRHDRATGEVVEDRQLEIRVERALERQPVYKYPNIDVHTYRGIVQLSGFVATEAQKEAATEIVTGVRGVTDVENNILLAPRERSTVRDYVPSREDNDSHAETSGDEHSSGAPSSAPRTTESVTNHPTR